MRKWIGWGIVGVLCAVCIVCPFGVWWYWEITVGKPIEREFGFRLGTPVIQEHGQSWPREVVSIESLRPDGVLGQAGFQEGDIICGLSVGEVFKVLHRGRGKQVTLEVVNGGDGPPLSQRMVRAITVKVPGG